MTNNVTISKTTLLYVHLTVINTLKHCEKYLVCEQQEYAFTKASNKEDYVLCRKEITS